MPKAKYSLVGKGTERNSSRGPGHYRELRKKSHRHYIRGGEFKVTNSQYLHKNPAPRLWEGSRSILDTTHYEGGASDGHQPIVDFHCPESREGSVCWQLALARSGGTPPSKIELICRVIPTPACLQIFLALMKAWNHL